MTGLTLDKLRIDLAGQTLVALNTSIAPGAVLTIMGASGAGKSTLVAALIGRLAPVFTLHGRVVLAGRDITDAPTERRQIGILFQDALLFAHLSVAGNLAFGLRASLQPRAARRQLIEKSLADYGLPGFADRDPATLSGGQRARVALLRTLLADPRALVLDEPFAGLDAALRGQIRALVFAEARAKSLPVILVSHDPEDARAAGGAVLTPLGQPVVLPAALPADLAADLAAALPVVLPAAP